jgi:peptidoglycan/LPS O-acetylase OafA/YrhL
MSHSKYRFDIDGLRAVAVLAVVLYHCGIGFPGGFVGVDVFFVISGYLITSIISADLDRGSFSLASFWDRRIRRIWPASVVVTAFTLLAGWFLLVPLDYARTAGDAFAQATMWANIRFWLRLDYFAEAIDLVPLLHMWSLAVEEQFYLVLPLILIALHRFGRRATLLVIVATALASFVSAVVLVPKHPMAAFFLLPPRMWELLVGCALALAPLARLGPRSLGWLEAAGALSVVTPFFLYDKTTPFPGAAALFPCLGTAALIAVGAQKQGLLQRLLGGEPLRSIGLASYSIYLWHWPLLAFARQMFGLELPAVVLAVVVALTAILSWMSYRFVETPCRRLASVSGRRTVVVGSMAATMAILVASLVINRTAGVPTRYSPEAVASLDADGVCRTWRYDEQKLDALKPTDALLPIGAARGGSTRPCFLFLGDSHGMAMSPAINSSARELGIAGEALLVSAWIPLPGLWIPGENRVFDAVSLRHKAVDWIAHHKPRHVIVCCRWSAALAKIHPDTILVHRLSLEGTPSTTDAEASEVFSQGVANLLEACESVGATLWFLGEIPYQPFTPWQLINGARLAEADGRCYGTTDRLKHAVVHRIVNDRLRFESNPSFRFLDLAAPFFDDTGRSITGAAGKMWYADDDHVSPEGAETAIRPYIGSMMQTIAEGCGSE